MSLDPITAGLDLAKTVVGTIWPDKSAQEQAQLAAALALVQGQMDINKAEATSGSLFIGGWRPFVGWLCGFALGWNYIIRPAIVAGMVLYGHPVSLPAADMAELMPVLLGMLGLGSLRTIERVKGVIPPGK